MRLSRLILFLFVLVLMSGTTESALAQEADAFYNQERSHQSLGYRTPEAVYCGNTA